MNPHSNNSELVSALADGELRGQELIDVWQGFGEGDDTIQQWRDYHLIGDILRSPASDASALQQTNSDLAFLDRFNQRLSASAEGASSESLVAEGGAPAAKAVFVGAPRKSRRAANDPIFQWKLVAGMASFAAVSMVAWLALSVSPTTSSTLSQSSDAQPFLVASPQGPVVRDARLEELLSAHRQLGVSSALQAPAGFLHSAAFEAPDSVGR